MSNIINKYFNNEVQKNTNAVVNAAIPEVDLSPVIEACGDLDQHNFAVESLMATANALTSLADFASGTLEDGGMDRGTAAALAIGADTHLNPLGLANNLPAIESFGGVSDRMTSTNFAIEGLKEDAKKIAQAVKNTILKIMASIKAFIKGLLDKVPGLTKKFEAIADQAAKADDKADAKFKVNADLMKSLHVEGGFKLAGLSTGLDILSELSEQTGKTAVPRAEGTLGKYDTITKAMTGAMAKKEDFITAFNGNKDVFTDSVNFSYTTLAKSATKAGKPIKEGETDFATEVITSPEFFGGKVLVTTSLKDVTVPDMTADNVAEIKGTLMAIAKTSQSVTEGEEKPKDIKEAEFDAMATADVAKLATSAIAILKNIEKSVSESSKLDKSKLGVINEAEKMGIALGDSEVDKDVASIGKSIVSASNNYVRSADATINQVIKLTVVSLANVASVLTTSLNSVK